MRDRDPPPVPTAIRRVPAIGEILDRKYAVEGFLGQGGMGVVLAARHVFLGQRVAVKVMLREAPTSSAAVERFMREGRAAAALTGEHVARVLDMGTLDDGAPYIVMEYLVGVDAATLLRRDGPMSIATAVSVVLHACAGVAEAHVLGVVHRDLKPANLFITTRVDGSLLVKVFDFGISKTAPPRTPEGDSLTLDGVPLGSPLYMSPEQVRSAKDVDERSDVWSLGVVLYELLTSTLPFKGETLADTYAQILGTPPRPLRQLRPEVSPELEAAVVKCMAHAVDARFQDLGELATVLAPWTPEGAWLAKRVRETLIVGARSRIAPAHGARPSSLPASTPSPGVAESPAPRGLGHRTWSRTRRLQSLLVSVTTAALFGVLALATYSTRSLGAGRASRASTSTALPLDAERATAARAALVEPAPVAAPIDEATPSTDAGPPPASLRKTLIDTAVRHVRARSSAPEDAAPAPAPGPSASAPRPEHHDIGIF